MNQKEIATKLKKLSRDDLIWIIAEMDSRTLGRCLDDALLEWQRKNMRKRMKEADAQLDLYIEKTEQYKELMDAAFAQGVDNIPPDTLVRASALGRESLAAYNRWKNLINV